MRSKLGSIAMTLLIVSSVLAAGLALVAGPVAADQQDVTVQVNGTSDSGIEGADVVLRDEADDSEVANDSTDSNGAVTFSSVSDGDYYAEVSDPGYVDLPESSNVTVSTSAVTLDVEMYAATEQENNTVTVTNNTETAYADATANSSLSTTDSSTRVAYRVVGINTSDNDSETTLDNGTMEVVEDTTESATYTLTDSDRDTYDEVRIIVDGETDHLDAVEGGKTESITGGGGSSGGIFNTTVMGIPLVAILGVLAVGWYMKEN